jgi:hypothetical protein
VDLTVIRARCHTLLGVLRDDPSIPEALWELLNALVARADRLEGLPPEEAPTKPSRKFSSSQLAAQHAKAATGILEDARADAEKEKDEKTKP